MNEVEAKHARLRLEAIIREASFDLVIEMPRRGLPPEGEVGRAPAAEDGGRPSEVAELVAFIRRTQKLLGDLRSVDRALTEIDGVTSITFKPDPDGQRRRDLDPASPVESDGPARGAARLSRESEQRAMWMTWLALNLEALEANALAQ